MTSKQTNKRKLKKCLDSYLEKNGGINFANLTHDEQKDIYFEGFKILVLAGVDITDSELLGKILAGMSEGCGFDNIALPDDVDLELLRLIPLDWPVNKIYLFNQLNNKESVLVLPILGKLLLINNCIKAEIASPYWLNESLFTDLTKNIMRKFKDFEPSTASEEEKSEVEKICLWLIELTMDATCFSYGESWYKTNINFLLKVLINNFDPDPERLKKFNMDLLRTIPSDFPLFKLYLWKTLNLEHEKQNAFNASPLLKRHKKFEGWNKLYSLSLCLKAKFQPPDWLSDDFNQRIEAIAFNSQAKTWDNEKAFGPFPFLIDAEKYAEPFDAMDIISEIESKRAEGHHIPFTRNSFEGLSELGIDNHGLSASKFEKIRQILVKTKR